MDIEKLLAQFKADQREKALAAGQMTLGSFIAALEAMPPDISVTYDVGGAPGEPNSFRGYYEQLAFSYGGTDPTVKDVLTLAKNAMGRTFQGYKGGDFIMHENTLVWAGGYGTSSDSRTIRGIERAGNSVVILTAEEER